MTTIKIGEKKYQVKNGFDECNVDEISHVLVSQNMLVGNRNNSTQLVRIKIGIFIRLSNVPSEIFLKLTRFQQLSLLTTVRWAFKSKIQCKPFEYFEVDGIKYYLPEDNYANTSSIEMALLNIWYLSFTRKNTPVLDNLYRIVAAICRPERRDLNAFMKMIEKWTGDRREVFNSVIAEEQAGFFKENAPLGVMIAVLQYWEVMNNRFVKRFDDVFSGGDSKAIFQNGEGWLSMLEDIAEVGLMGDINKVYETNAYSLMMYVLHKQKKIERLEEIRESENKN